MLAFFLSSVLPLAGTIALGALGWMCTHFIGRLVLRLWELREEALEAMFVYANVGADAADSSRAKQGQEELRRIAARIDAVDVALPKPIWWLLHWRGYNLAKASQGLTGLSNNLTSRDGSKAWCRVRIQKGLRLPVDPTDQERVKREERLNASGEL